VTCKDHIRKCADASAPDERKKRSNPEEDEDGRVRGRGRRENEGEQTRVRRCERPEEQWAQVLTRLDSIGGFRMLEYHVGLLTTWI